MTHDFGDGLLAVDSDLLERFLGGESDDPHRLLGPHETAEGSSGWVIRVFAPDARSVECLLSESGEAVPMRRVDPRGLHAVFLPSQTSAPRYRLRIQGSPEIFEDPYRFPSTFGELDKHLIGEGTHRRMWECLGAHPMSVDGTKGVRFAVWAPNARRVSVVGTFCDWDGRLLPMRRLEESGIFELFVPSATAGSFYKYEILTVERETRTKTDPFAFGIESSDGYASRVVPGSEHAWGDREWMSRRAEVAPEESPILIYEAHLGSWKRRADGPLGFREIAPLLAEHVARLGFTHVELLPVMEHPFGGSWGYQVSGYYAPTSRHGDTDDLRFLVDTLHQSGIGVILDWVPAHFPKDDFALARFDGTALYEHLDPRLGEHPDWGTLIFNFGRNTVRNFLIANALYWLDEFHADGLRVDAVASMIYRDYSREEGEWIPNKYGGKENLEAIEFLRSLNEIVHEEHPGCLMIAEESTCWPGVTAPVKDGGLGFDFKWNMGWMHDTLEFFGEEPKHRRFHWNKITFAASYEHSERFMMPLSHDEVVHGKGSLLGKMQGDLEERLANLKLLLTYQYTRPGKVLLFMGTELGTLEEWNHDAGLDWTLASEEGRARFGDFVRDLGLLYRSRSPLFRTDTSPEGFRWIECDDNENSVLSYLRFDGTDHLVVVLNLSAEPHEEYCIGVPRPGTYRQVLRTDDLAYGGRSFDTPTEIESGAEPKHGQDQSVRLRLPPLAGLIFEPKE